MKSVANNTKVEYIEKKSRFIGLVYHVENQDDIDSALSKSKADYPGANHYTYAYILDDLNQKYNDDGEPTRTAGFPILEVIKNNQLNDCLVIVIRYFGGILLGAGGLIRAYSHTAALAISEAPLSKKITTYTCKVTCDYDNLGSVDKIVREKTVLLNVDYSNIVTFKFQTNELKIDSVRQDLFNHNSYSDKLEILESKAQYVKIDY